MEGTSDSDQYYLRWNNFENNLTSGFSSFLHDEAMVDVSLCVEGKIVQAHKLILSVCSPYFKNMFEVNPCKHPIVILKDVGYQELSDMLNFMYKGEANVRQEDLPSFLKLAETLKVRGLAGSMEEVECNDSLKKKPVGPSKARLRSFSDKGGTIFDTCHENGESFSRKKMKRAGSPIKINELKSAFLSTKKTESEESCDPGSNVENISLVSSTPDITTMKEESRTDDINMDSSYEVHRIKGEATTMLDESYDAGPSSIDETGDAMLPQEWGSTRRTSKPLSAIWSYFHFDYLENKSACKLCGKIFKASPKTGTASVKYHLHFAHRIQGSESAVPQ